MGYFYTLTKAGFALQAKLFAEGGDMVITRVEVGSGVLPADQDPTLLAALVQPRARATSTTPLRRDCVVDFDIEYRSDLNGGLEDAFLINEFGVYAHGAEGTEVPDGEKRDVGRVRAPVPQYEALVGGLPDRGAARGDGGECRHRRESPRHRPWGDDTPL